MNLTKVASQLDLTRSESTLKPVLEEETLNEIEEFFKNFQEHIQYDIVLSRYEPSMSTVSNSLKLVRAHESNLITSLNKLKMDHKDLGLKHERAIKLANEDRETIRELAEQLQKALDITSKSKSKEKRALETLNSLKLEISNLSKLVEQVVGLTFGQEHSVRELAKEKENLQLDNKFLNTELEDLKQVLRDLKLKETEQDRLVDEAKLRVSQAEQELLVNTIQNQQNLRRIEKLEDENTCLKKTNESKDANLSHMNQNLNLIKLELSKQEQATKEYQLMLEKAKKENDLLNNRVHKLQHEMENLYTKLDSLHLENTQLSAKLKSQDDLIDQLKQETNQIYKLKETYDRKLVQLEQDKLELNKEKHDCESKCDILSKQNEKIIKELELMNKRCQHQTSEKDQLNAEITKLKFKLDSLDAQLNESKHKIKKLENENEILKKEITKLELKVTSFDKERCSYGKLKNAYLIKIDTLTHELKLKASERNDLNKKLRENESKLDKLSRLHENVRVERNSLSKLNNESKEQIAQLREQNESAKLSLASKLDLIRQSKIDYDRLCYENSKVEKSLNQTREQLDACVTQVDELKEKQTSLELNERKLLQIISELNKKIEIKSKAYEKIQLERNVFGTQLVRRNDEISLLYEKIKLVESLNQRGENAFNKMRNELELARANLKTVSKEKEVKVSENFMLKKCKQELCVTQEELLLERAKRDMAEKKAGYNVHMWRRLQGSDPTKYELITRVNYLQKRLIQKSVEKASLQLKFIEKDRLFAELSRSFAKPIATRDTQDEFKHVIEAKNKQIKCLIAENVMLVKLNDDSKVKSNDLLQQLKEFKQKYFDLKSSFRSEKKTQIK